MRLKYIIDIDYFKILIGFMSGNLSNFKLKSAISCWFQTLDINGWRFVFCYLD